MQTPFENLKTKFSQGLSWNGFFYAIYRILSTLLSFVLYRQLSTRDFSLWANVNSLVFLTLLWIDCGFRKSVPRYCPEFANSPAALHRFTKTILLFQLLLLIITIPIFLVVSQWLYSATHNENLSQGIWYLGAILLISEGMLSLQRLVYHSHFWIKQFTLVTTGTLFLEMTINYLLIASSIDDGYYIVAGIIGSKIVMGFITNIVSIRLLVKLYSTYYDTQLKSIPLHYTTSLKAFAEHSAVMWGNNILKSLTERNFMVPLLTITMGQAAANVFKIANDGALLFYRFIIKTIGATDTALFAHVEQSPDAKKLMPIAFTKVMTSIAALCLPLLASIVLLFVVPFTHMHDKFVFHIFIIISIGYLIESILSPYERVLEVKRRYAKLLIAYLPYACTIITLLLFNLIPSFGLVTLIFIIHGVRLVSSFIMIPYACNEYSLTIPSGLRYMIIFIAFCMISIPIWYLYSQYM